MALSKVDTRTDCRSPPLLLPLTHFNANIAATKGDLQCGIVNIPALHLLTKKKLANLRSIRWYQFHSSIHMFIHKLSTVNG